MTIQEFFDNEQSNNIVLSAGEYEGPLTINRPCTIEGNASTIWATHGPVITIKANNVVLNNLRVEVTGANIPSNETTSIVTLAQDTKLNNIEVNTNVVGFDNESMAWNLPRVLQLGSFSSEEQNTFSFSIESAGEATISSSIQNVTVSPSKLVEGNNTIVITTDRLRDNTLIYGALHVKTTVVRRIYITGKAEKNAPVISHMNEQIAKIPTADNHSQMEQPDEVIAPAVSQNNFQMLKRGQRINIVNPKADVLKVVFEQGDNQPFDIDGYVFLLQESGKVRQDEDLIYFGNQESKEHAVKISTIKNKTLIFIHPNKIEPDIKTISICFSIYGDNPNENFSMISTPLIRIFVKEREIYRFKLERLNLEKTVVAIEIYKYNGSWKMNCVGAGYTSGLKTLCESYGVQVE